MNKVRGKNILAIYYVFPPQKGVGTLRNYKFYKSLKEHARKINVLTTSNREFLPHDEYDINYDESIHNIKTFDYRTLHHRLFNSKGSMIPNEDKTGWVTSQLLKFMRDPTVDRYIGEGGWFFIRNAVKQGQELIDKEGIDTLISSYRPLTAHWVAYILKKRNPHLKWIADYRDLTTVILPEESRLRKKHKKVNSKLLNLADEVVTVSQGLKDILLTYHDNVSVLRNGIDRETMIYPDPERYSFFTITYTGIIYKGFQEADILIKALAHLVSQGEIDLRDLQFINAGKDGSYFRELLKKHKLETMLVDKGVLPRKEVLEIQRKSHINLLLTWASPKIKGIVTAKIYEYLAAQNSICAIINGIKDPEIETIVEGTEMGKVFYHSDGRSREIEAYILQQYRSWKHGSIRHNKKKNIERYTWEYQFARWAHEEQNTNQKTINS